MKNYTIELKEDAIYVTKGEERLKVSYDQTRLPWEEGKKFAEERGMSLGTIDQRLLLAEVREEANKVIKKAGKELISDGWHWTEKENPLDPSCAYVVGVYRGSVYDGRKGYSYVVRPVSAF